MARLLRGDSPPYCFKCQRLGITAGPQPKRKQGMGKSWSRQKGLPPSAKMLTMLKIIHDALGHPGSDKIVIFSQWTRFLNIIENYLQDSGILSELGVEYVRCTFPFSHSRLRTTHR